MSATPASRDGGVCSLALNPSAPGQSGILADLLARAELKALILIPEGGHLAAVDPGLVGATLRLIASSPVPALALVRGECLGAAALAALACPFRFASPEARLGLDALPPVLRGEIAELAPAGASLPASGALGAAQALVAGLVDRVVAQAVLEEEARAFFEGLVARRTPAQVRAVTEAVRNARQRPLAEALRRETELFCNLARVFPPPRAEAP